MSCRKYFKLFTVMLKPTDLFNSINFFERNFWSYFKNKVYNSVVSLRCFTSLYSRLPWPVRKVISVTKFWHLCIVIKNINFQSLNFQAGEFLVHVGLRDEVGVVDRYKPCHDCGGHWQCLLSEATVLSLGCLHHKI